MAYSEEDFKRFMEHELKPNDTFHFECGMCGECCRNRQEPILLTGADTFRIAKGLDISVVEVLKRYTDVTIGYQSNVPIFTLAEKMNGSCSLMHNGKCSVQQFKPIVCALYPLGRYFDSSDSSFHYFMNDNCCTNSIKPGKTWTLKDWLEAFHIEESAELTEQWNKLLLGILAVTSKMKKTAIQGKFLAELVMVLYTNYYTSIPYDAQIERNMELAQEVFRKRFHKKLTF